MRETVDRVSAQLKTHEEVATAAVFTGGTAPRFYYNVAPKEPANYLAQILVNTRTEEGVPKLLVKLRAELDRNIPGARCVVKQLEQGPELDEHLSRPASVAATWTFSRSSLTRHPEFCVRSVVTRCTMI